MESAIESICSRVKQGNSLEQAIYSVTNFNKITEEIINDIEAEKNNGLSDELALRVTLQKFSSREQT